MRTQPQHKFKLVVDHVPVGPSEAFIRRSRNPKLAEKALRERWIFRPTTKGENDVVI